MNGRHFIGVYDYTIILTFMSLVSALCGMILAYDNNFVDSLFCLILCGMFDMLDGRVARTKKTRTDSECLFGIQLDSLCDVIAFGVFPTFLCFTMGIKDIIGMIALVFYCICGVMRLAYFNTRETIEFYSEGESEHVYYGLPITSIAAILPVTFVFKFVLVPQAFSMLLLLVLVITATLFITGFKLRKPKMPILIAGGVVVLACYIFIVIQSGGLVNILA